jgi:hypothetical protein
MGCDADGLVHDDDVVVVVDDAHAVDRLGCSLDLGVRQGHFKPGIGHQAIGLGHGTLIEGHRT